MARYGMRAVQHQATYVLDLPENLSNFSCCLNLNPYTIKEISRKKQTQIDTNCP